MTGLCIALQSIGAAAMLGYIVYVAAARKASAYSILTSALVSAFLNAFAYLQYLNASSLETALAVKPFDIMGSSLAFFLLYCFVRDMQGAKIPFAVSIALLAADSFGIISAVSDRVFHLYYKSIETAGKEMFFDAEVRYGIGFYVLLASMIVKTALIIIIAADGYVGKRGDKTSSLWAFFSILLPMLGMTAYSFRIFNNYNPSSLLVCASCVIISEAVQRGRKFDMVKTARDSVIETMRDALIVTDHKLNIVDSNPAARRIFPEISQGRKKAAALAADLVADTQNEEFEMDGKYYEKHITRLYNNDGSGNGYSVLVIDVTDTKKYVDRLIEMSRKADMANSAKSDFLANMSHEIRTPMNAITGFAELCLQEKTYIYASDIKTAAKNLISIINDILDISKIEAGKLELVPSVYDTMAMLDDVISIINVQLEKKNLEFKIDIDKKLPKKMYGDEVRLKQILINLLGNSVKFTNEGRISLSVKQIDRSEENVSIMFKISDTGIGIKKEEMSKLFANFQQLDTHKNRKIEGSGLGLSISKTLAERMGGNISVSSVYGKGSVFTAVVVQKISDPSPISGSPSRAGADSEESKLTLYAPDAHVLVVDDNKVNLDVTARLLAIYGIKAEIADSGEKAVKMINSSYYDLVFMDHMMPDMDGVETTKIIRSQKDAYSQGLPVVALTANAVSGAREMFLESGFNDFISKPIQIPVLEKILEAWLPEQLVKRIDKNKKPAASSTFFDIMGIESERTEENCGKGEDIIIPNVDVASGLKLCGGNLNAYLAVLKTFMETAPESILRIENFAHSRDYKNYTTEVHGLKSSSLAIGAMGLSEMARKLEEAGKAENYKLIQEDTPALIARFSEITENVKPFVEPGEADPDSADKPPVDADTLKEKLYALLEAIDNLDSRGALEIFSELALYSYDSSEIVKCIESGRRYADNFAYEKAEASVRRIMEIAGLPCKEP